MGLAFDVEKDLMLAILYDRLQVQAAPGKEIVMDIDDTAAPALKHEDQNRPYRLIAPTAIGLNFAIAIFLTSLGICKRFSLFGVQQTHDGNIPLIFRSLFSSRKPGGWKLGPHVSSVTSYAISTSFYGKSCIRCLLLLTTISNIFLLKTHSTFPFKSYPSV